MSRQSLSQYANVNNLLKAALAASAPRSQLHQICREFGLHSWHSNAAQNPKYSQWSNNES